MHSPLQDDPEHPYPGDVTARNLQVDMQYAEHDPPQELLDPLLNPFEPSSFSQPYNKFGKVIIATTGKTLLEASLKNSLLV